MSYTQEKLYIKICKYLVVINMRIDGFKEFQQLNISTLNHLITRLDIGETVRVQITGVSPRLLSLRLPDGSNINAAGMIPIDVNIGDFLDLIIKAKTDSQIFVEILKETPISNEIKTADLKDTLMSLNIFPEHKNIEIAKGIVKNNIPFTKENFNSMLTLLNKFSHIEPDKLLFLFSNNIPVNEKNIAMFNKYIEHKQLLGGSLEKLTQQLTQLEDATTPTGHVNIKDPLTASSIDDKNGLKHENNGIKFVEGDTAQIKGEQVENFTKPYLNSENDQLLSSTIDNKEINHLKKLIASLIKTVDKSKADNLPEEINASKVIRKTMDVLETIKTKIAGLNASEKNDILDTVNDIEESIHFLHQLNKFTAFVQIPVNINDYNTTAELYVFKDTRGKKKIDPSNATIFLSLATANLGQIEAFISIINKNVECNFQMKEKETLSFIKNNITPLYSLLEGHGYKLIKVTYKEVTEKTNIMSVQQHGKQAGKRYSFDIRV